ncbi:MAG: hypothetical protein ABSB58_10740 [Gemmatimonadales bacterium]
MKQMTEYERQARVRNCAVAMGKSAPWAFGVMAAADLADGYNGCTTHPWRLGDCILLKLNLITKPMVRKNRGASASPVPRREQTP